MTELKTHGQSRVTFCEWSAMPPGVMAWSLPKLLLRVITEFMSMQWQGLVLMSLAHITIKEHGNVPDEGSSRRPLGCPRSCIKLELTLTGYSTLESWPHLSPLATLRRAGPASHPGCTTELALLPGVEAKA